MNNNKGVLDTKGHRTQRTRPHQTSPLPPTGLYYRWQAALAKLESRLISLTEAITIAMDGQGDRNLFDLIAATNSLLDLTDRLHQRAWVIREMTLATQGRTPNTNTRLELPEDLLLGTPPTDRQV